MRQRRPTRPRGAGRVRNAIGFGLVLVILFVFTSGLETFWTRLDQRRFPWAYPESGRPTITGTWIGTLTTGGGVRRAVYLDLRLEPLEFRSPKGRRMYRRAGSPKLVGEASLCGGPADIQRFALTGDNQDDTASRFYLVLGVADSTPPNGLAPSHLLGRWNGRDSLALEASMYLRRGASAITSTDDPHTGQPASLPMRRGTEADFRALCARIPNGR